MSGCPPMSFTDAKRGIIRAGNGEIPREGTHEIFDESTPRHGNNNFAQEYKVILADI